LSDALSIRPHQSELVLHANEDIIVITWNDTDNEENAPN
jgi:hypothetical protein